MNDAFDARSYLESKGFNVKDGTGHEIHTHCPFCNEEPSKRGRLYINTDPNQDPYGLFHCKLCGETGAYNKLRKHLGDEPIVSKGTEKELSTDVQQVLQEASDYYLEKLSENPEAFEYLRSQRGLSQDIIAEQKIGWADGNLKSHLLDLGYDLGVIKESGLVKESGEDYLVNEIVIPYIVNNNVITLRGKDIDGKYRSLPHSKVRLFNSDDAWRAEELFITEGEFDAMILKQLGLNAIGVPGAQLWQEGWNPYIESVRRIYIVFDPDATGRMAAEKLAKKIPKARIINLPEDSPGNDVNDWIVHHDHTLEEFLALTKSTEGSLLVSPIDALVFWREIEGNPNLAGIKFDIEAFDRALSPGLLPGQVMVMLAKPGTGKTAMVVNTFHRILMHDPSKRVLFFSLEQTSNEWFDRAYKIHRFYDPHVTVEQTAAFYNNRFMMVEKNRLTEEELLASVDDFDVILDGKPDIIAVDYLGYWAKNYKGKDTYEKVSNAIMTLKAIAKDLKIPFITPHQTSRSSSAGEEIDLTAAKDSSSVEDTADHLLVAWSKDQRRGISRENRSGEVEFKLVKSRRGGTGMEFSLMFAPLSTALVPPEDRANYMMAQKEIQAAKKGDSWESFMDRRLTGDKTINVEGSNVESF